MKSINKSSLHLVKAQNYKSRTIRKIVNLNKLLLLLLLLSPSSATEISEPYLDGIKVPIEGIGLKKIRTSQGVLVGALRDGLLKEEYIHKTVDWYLGIPYAKPPVGALRFKKPAALGSWEGERQALMYGPSCPILFRHVDDRLSHNNKEDCLYLNVYSPLSSLLKEHQVPETLFQRRILDKERPDYLMPVMLYIHGGSYEYGSGSAYVGDTLAQFGVVVVTINYRLGMLGFLSARSKHLKGNYGLHDQIAALKWVRENIAFFGGDPSMVTVFGNSAGAASVGILSVSPLAKGLFKQAVIQSGSPMAYWSYYREQDVDLRERFKHLAFLANCSLDGTSRFASSAHHYRKTSILNKKKEENEDDKDIKDMVECLRGLDQKYLFTAVFNQMGLPYIKPTNDDDIPCIDGEILLGPIEETFERGLFHVENLMIGIVTNEWSQHLGTYIDQYEREMKIEVNTMPEAQVASMQNTFRYVLQNKLGYSKELTDLAYYLYFPNYLKNISAVTDSYIKFVSDISFLVPSIDYARLINNHSNSSQVYFYVYGHFWNEWDDHWKNNYHSLELAYLFGSPFRGNHIMHNTMAQYRDVDREASVYLMKLWTNFAKTGDPKRGNDEHTRMDLQWESFDGEMLNYANLSTPNSSYIGENLRSHYVQFWNTQAPKIEELAVKNHRDSEALEELRRQAISRYDAIYIAAIVTLTTLVAGLSIALCSVCLRSQFKDGSP